MIAPDHSHDSIRISKKNQKTIGAILVVAIILGLFTFGARVIKNKMASSGGTISANNASQSGQSSGYSGEVTGENQNPKNATLSDQDKQEQEIETLVRDYYDVVNRDYNDYKQAVTTNPERTDKISEGYLNKLKSELEEYYLPEAVAEADTWNEIEMRAAMMQTLGFSIEKIEIYDDTNVRNNPPLKPLIQKQKFSFDSYAAAYLSGQASSLTGQPFSGNHWGYYIVLGKKNNKWYFLF